MLFCLFKEICEKDGRYDSKAVAEEKRRKKNNVGNYVLGLAVSMNSTGWAMLSISSKGVVRFVWLGIIKANTKHTHGQRLKGQRDNWKLSTEIYSTESRLFPTYKVGASIVQSIWCCRRIFRRKWPCRIWASTIKKVVVGIWKASKSQVEESIRKRLNFSIKFQIRRRRRIEYNRYYFNNNPRKRINIGGISECWKLYLWTQETAEKIREQLEKTIALNLTNHVGEILQKITKGFPEIQSNNWCILYTVPTCKNSEQYEGGFLLLFT